MAGKKLVDFLLEDNIISILEDSSLQDIVEVFESWEEKYKEYSDVDFELQNCMLDGDIFGIRLWGKKLETDDDLKKRVLEENNRKEKIEKEERAQLQRLKIKYEHIEVE